MPERQARQKIDGPPRMAGGHVCTFKIDYVDTAREVPDRERALARRRREAEYLHSFCNFSDKRPESCMATASKKANAKT